MFGFERLDDWQKSTEIATGSVFEVVAQSFVSRKQGFLSEADFKAPDAAAEAQGRMLSGLRKSQLQSAG